MIISVRKLEGQAFDVEVESSDTIDHVKTVIQEVAGILPSQQTLVLKKMRLTETSRSLEELQIVDGAVLVLVVSDPPPKLICHLADPEGDDGIYFGECDGAGVAHGNGQLHYFDDGSIFVGEFQGGKMSSGVVWNKSMTGARFSMEGGRWTGFFARAYLVDKFPSDSVHSLEQLEAWEGSWIFKAEDGTDLSPAEKIRIITEHGIDEVHGIDSGRRFKMKK